VIELKGPRRIFFLSLLALLIFAFQGSARADTMTIQITGLINFHSANAPVGYWDATVQNGAPYIFTLTYDSLATDADAFDPTRGTYNSSAPYQLSISFGDYTFSNTGTTVTVLNDANLGGPPQDVFAFSNLNAFTQNSLSLSQNGIQTNLFFSNTSFLNSDSLSEVKTYPLTDFSSSQMIVSGFFNNGSGFQTATVQGTIDSFIVVPEPSVASLLLAGAAFAVLGSRFRRHSRVR
jgi:hypothetical protein